jgi:hypothetical protein
LSKKEYGKEIKMGKAMTTQDLQTREPEVVGEFVEPVRENKLEKGLPKSKDKNRLKELSKYHRRKK